MADEKSRLNQSGGSSGAVVTRYGQGPSCEAVVVPWWWIGASGIVLLWSYWETLAHLFQRWSIEPEYSHGVFVPVFSMALLWLRRDELAKVPWRGSWWGLLPLALGIAMRVSSAYWFFTLMGAVALLPTLVGVVLLIGGFPAFRWAWPSIAFLVFMIPLPGFAAGLLAHPLQRIATSASTYLLQLLGIAAVADGNVILLDESKIGVVEACNGLRMLILFFAVSAAAALLVQRTLWERLVILASAVPIALCVNIVRITVTGVLYELTTSSVAEHFFHDVGGWLMGPLAFVFLWLEMKFLDRAMITVSQRPLAIAKVH
jgi:exosortase